MLRVHSADLWNTISSLCSSAEPKAAAIAYVTSDAHVRFGAGDTLIVDASDEAIAVGRTAVSTLRAAFVRGARLFSIDGLHAKVFCFARHVVVGSANASAASVDGLIEAAMVSDDAVILAETKALLARLEAEATPIGASFLNRIERIEVAGAAGRQRPMPSAYDLHLPIKFWSRSVAGRQRMLVVPAEFAYKVRAHCVAVGGSVQKRTNVLVSWADGRFIANTFGYDPHNNEWKLTVSQPKAPALYRFSVDQMGKRFNAIFTAHPLGAMDSLQLDLSREIPPPGR